MIPQTVKDKLKNEISKRMETPKTAGGEKKMRPMLLHKCPTDVTLAQLQSTGNYIAEVKEDGERIIATKINGEVKLWAREHKGKQNEKASYYPEVVMDLKMCKCDNFALDGEMCYMENGKSDFYKFQRRSKIRNPDTKILNELKLTYKVFDMLLYEGNCLDMTYLIKRKEILQDFIEKNKLSLSRIEEVKWTPNLETLWKTAKEEGQEGIVLKDTKSFYSEGKLTHQWLKYKEKKVYYEAVLDYNSKKRAVSSLVTKMGDVSLPQSYKYQQMIPTLQEAIPQGRVTAKVECDVGLTNNNKWRFPTLKTIHISPPQ